VPQDDKYTPCRSDEVPAQQGNEAATKVLNTASNARAHSDTADGLLAECAIAAHSALQITHS